MNMMRKDFIKFNTKYFGLKTKALGEIMNLCLISTLFSSFVSVDMQCLEFLLWEVQNLEKLLSK